LNAGNQGLGNETDYHYVEHAASHCLHCRKILRNKMMVYADPMGPFPAQTPMSIAGCSAIIPGNKAKH
jgi:hypothetical protein